MRLLSDPAERAFRETLRGAPHLAPLGPYLAELRARHGAVPDPDPLDGGAGARLLLLLETPGPRMGVGGIVSRDNPTGTGRNLRRMLDAAAIARADTLIWNAVPWIIHAPAARNRAPTRAEIATGIATLPRLLAALPALRVVVLAGRSAAAAEPAIRSHRPDLPILRMHHPSPTIQCTDPAIPAGCAATLLAASSLLATPARRSAA